MTQTSVRKVADRKYISLGMIRRDIKAELGKAGFKEQRMGEDK